MFNVAKEVFIVFLSFSGSLAREAKVTDQTKCPFLNDEPCMIRPSLIDMSPVELKYYPFMINLNKYTGSCNVLSPDLCSKRNKRHIKAFNMITNKNEAKAMTEHISCDCKCKFNTTTCNSKQQWNNKTC